MGSTFLSLHYHIVFSTKDRSPFLRDTWRVKLHEYLGGTVRGLGGIPEAIGGVADHVHLLVGLRATHCLADFMQEMKKATSVWAKDNYEPSFGWQDGYAAFTVSYTHIDSVKEYIRTQEEHHRQTDFIEELKRLLQKNGVGFWHSSGVREICVSGYRAYRRCAPRPAANFWRPSGLRRT